MGLASRVTVARSAAPQANAIPFTGPPPPYAARSAPQTAAPASAWPQGQATSPPGGWQPNPWGAAPPAPGFGAQAYAPAPGAPAAPGLPPAEGYPPRAPQGAPSYAPVAAAQPMAAVASGGGRYAQQILARMGTIVQYNGLHTFYPPQRLQALAARVSQIDFDGLAARWQIPVEIAL